MLWFWFCFLVTLHIFSESTIKQKGQKLKAIKVIHRVVKKPFTIQFTCSSYTHSPVTGHTTQP